jgi:hypothetical protein
LFACSQTNGTSNCQWPRNWKLGVQRCEAKGLNHSDPVASTIVYYDDAAEPWIQPILFIIFAIVVVMFLTSGAGELTMKYGLSWHVGFFMVIVNMDAAPRIYYLKLLGGHGIPGLEWDSDYMVANVCSFVGIMIAIMCTLVNCANLRNIHHLSDDVEGVTKQTLHVLDQSLDYMAESTGKNPMRLQIREKVAGIKGLSETLRSNLNSSWWEVFDIGRYDPTRKLVAMLATQGEDLNDVMYVLVNSVMVEDFQGRHQECFKTIGPALRSLFTSTSKLQTLLAVISGDGRIDDEELEDITEQLDAVKQDRANVYAQMRSVTRCGVTEDMSNESIFVFAVALWSRTICNHANSIMEQTIDKGHCFRVIPLALKEGFLNTWRPSQTAIENPDRRNFALRNTISVVTCFLIGVFGHSSIFTPYSANMANTLALLISHFSGSAMQKNLKRLLGVTMGKSLPVIVLALLAFVPCERWYRPSVQGFTICLFVFAFEYITFTSDQWGYVGQLIAAFGCPVLMTVCYGSSDFDASYRDIGQITAAILIQMLVDWALIPSDPKHVAVQLLASTTNDLKAGFTAFFDNDLIGMKDSLHKAATTLSKAQSLKGECDPKLEVVPGASGPFKYEAYLQTLDIVEEITSDLRILITCATDLRQEGEGAPQKMTDAKENDGDCLLLEIMNSTQAMPIAREDIENSLDQAFTTACATLGHFTEDEFQVESLKELEKRTDLATLSGRSQIYEELDRKSKDGTIPESSHGDLTDDYGICLCVAMQCLCNTTRHSAQLTQLMITYAYN